LEVYPILGTLAIFFNLPSLQIVAMAMEPVKALIKLLFLLILRLAALRDGTDIRDLSIKSCDDC